MSLLKKCRLHHQTPLSCLIEEVRTISETIVTELLCNALRVGTLWTFFDKVVEEAKNFEVKALQAVVFVVVKFLGNCVVVTLKEVLALLVRRLFIFHRVEFKLLVHLLL